MLLFVVRGVSSNKAAKSETRDAGASGRISAPGNPSRSPWGFFATRDGHDSCSSPLVDVMSTSGRRRCVKLLPWYDNHHRLAQGPFVPMEVRSGPFSFRHSSPLARSQGISTRVYANKLW